MKNQSLYLNQTVCQAGAFNAQIIELIIEIEAFNTDN